MSAPRGVVRVWLATVTLWACAGGELAESADGAFSPVPRPRLDGSVALGEAGVPVVPSLDADVGGPPGDATPGPVGGTPSGGGATPPDRDAEPTVPGPPTDPNDQDGDGVPAADDCDDLDPDRAPNLPETPGDGVDTDCDTQDDLACFAAADCPPAWSCRADYTCQPGCRPDDCRPGLRCNSIERVCLPDPSLSGCGRDVDCPADQACVPYRVVRTGSLGLTCQPREGEAGPGAPCAADDECRSGVCLRGTGCFGPCRDDADCGPGAACAWTRLQSGETQNRFRVCVRQLRACSRDADCEGGGVCAAIARPDAPRGVVLACVAPAPDAGLGGPGAACAQDADCRSGACLVEDGLCIGACVDAADCAAGQRCYAAGVYYLDDGGTAGPADDVESGLPQCLPDFGSDAACDALRFCPENEVCFPRRGADGRTYEPRCRRAVGPGVAGAMCDADGDCATGACVDGACVGVCHRPEDCAPGSFCVERRWVLDDRGTEDVYDDHALEVGLCVR